MAKQPRYFIGPGLLGDIREVITRVDAIAPKTSGAAQPVRLQDLQRPGGLRLSRGTFSGSWAIGETVAVTIHGSTNTVQVTNYCSPVAGNSNSTQSLNVIFGSVMGTVSAIEVQQNTCTLSVGGLDLRELPGYDENYPQLLGHGESGACGGMGSLKWYTITQCGTTAV